MSRIFQVGHDLAQLLHATDIKMAARVGEGGGSDLDDDFHNGASLGLFFAKQIGVVVVFDDGEGILLAGGGQAVHALDVGIQRVLIHLVGGIDGEATAAAIGAVLVDPVPTYLGISYSNLPSIIFPELFLATAPSTKFT